MSNRKNSSFNELSVALDRESWHWLSDQLPTIADGVQGAVRQGAKPDDVRRFVMAHIQRFELALRCEQAARWLGTSGE